MAGTSQTGFQRSSAKNGLFGWNSVPELCLGEGVIGERAVIFRSTVLVSLFTPPPFETGVCDRLALRCSIRAEARDESACTPSPAVPPTAPRSRLRVRPAGRLGHLTATAARAASLCGWFCCSFLPSRAGTIGKIIVAHKNGLGILETQAHSNEALTGNRAHGPTTTVHREIIPVKVRNYPCEFRTPS